MNMVITQAEYLWLDGAAPVQRLRSKSRIVAFSATEPVIETFPEWSFDGSSTYQAIGAKHEEHIAVYGDGLAERLTGLHETCSIHEFREGIADRGASVRIPRHVAAQGYGYLEDRRPAANADPYLVTTRILETVCGAAAQAESNGSARAHRTHLQEFRPTADSGGRLRFGEES
jgi:glutamine synthetase